MLYFRTKSEGRPNLSPRQVVVSVANMRKNPDLKNKMVSPVPVIIQPTEEGSYQLLA